MIVIATNNAHKVHELGLILPEYKLCTPKDLGLTFYYEETGNTFAENAFGKAQALYNQLQEKAPIDQGSYTVIADDSGVCVEALDGAPGVYSARFGYDPEGPVLDDAGRTALLLERMKGTTNRRAWYVCCMVAYFGPDRFISVQEPWYGTLTTEVQQGTTGFGYDPVMYIPEFGCTVARMSEADKAKVSHRGKATRSLVRLLSKPENEGSHRNDASRLK